MDKAEKANWAWMEQHMPSVVLMMRRERVSGRGPQLGECWRRGVINEEPGWFFARENGVSVGVPSVEFLKDPNQATLQAMFPGAALLMLRGNMVSYDVRAPAPAEPRRLTQAEQNAREIVHGNVSSQSTRRTNAYGPDRQD